MRFLYVMDPIHRVLPDKDTIFAFMRAAEARGARALHCEPHELFLEDGEAWADAHPVTVHHAAPWLSFGVRQKVRLADVEAVFIRKDPPFDDAYLYATLLLEHARGKTVLVNDPRGLRDANEKIYATSFAAHMPRAHRHFEQGPHLRLCRSHGRKGRHQAAARRRRDRRDDGREGRSERSIHRRHGDRRREETRDGARVPAGGAGKATSASCSSRASRSARSTACRAPTTSDRTSTSAAPWSRRRSRRRKER
jgi:hypothetical protein